MKKISWDCPFNFCDVTVCVQAVGELMSRVQARIQAVANDDTESLSALLNIQDVLIFCYGMDEDEIGSVNLMDQMSAFL